MNRIVLFIADEDRIYLEYFGKYFTELTNPSFQVHLFTEGNELESYLNSMTPVPDIVLLGKGFEEYAERLAGSRDYTLCILTESMPASCKIEVDTEKNEIKTQDKNETEERIPSKTREKREIRILHRYQHMGQLAKLLYSFWLGKQREYVDPYGGISMDRSKIIAFFSPGGGTGVSTLAAASAVEMAGIGHKVFYLNLEFLSSMSVFLGNEGFGNLSQILFSLKQDPDKLIPEILKLTKTLPPVGPEHIGCIDNPFDLEALTLKDAEILIRSIQKAAQCKYIFMDIGSAFNRLNVRLLSMSDLIVLVSTSDVICREKLEKFLALAGKLELLGQENITGKILHVLNKEGLHEERTLCKGSENVSPANHGIQVPYAMKIPYFSQLIVESNSKICSGFNLNFTDKMRRLAELIHTECNLGREAVGVCSAI